MGHEAGRAPCGRSSLQMSVLAARGRDLFVERKNNLLIWLVHQNLKLHPQKTQTTGIASHNKSWMVAGPPNTATQGTLCGAQHCSIPHSPCTRLGTKINKPEHDVWLG